MSLPVKTQLEQHAHDIEALKQRLKIVPEEPALSDISTALYDIKSEIEQSKRGHAQDQLEQYYQSYRDNAPKVDHYDMLNLGKLFEYSVDFVEKIAPSLMKLLQIFSADSSAFKLNTCITLLFTVLPPSTLTKDMASSIIVTIVDMKNRIYNAIDTIVDQTPVKPTSGKVGTGKPKKRLFGFLQQN